MTPPIWSDSLWRVRASCCGGCRGVEGSPAPGVFPSRGEQNQRESTAPSSRQCREFIRRTLDPWASQGQVTLDFSRPGEPTDNPFIEPLHGSFRAECLNTHWFLSLDDACRKAEQWRRKYNAFWPHSALKNPVPSAFAAQFASVQVQPEIPI
jgi:transposase InsO family protein